MAVFLIAGTVHAEVQLPGGSISTSASADSCCHNMRGNVICDGSPQQLAHMVALINHLFRTFETLCCPDEADVDGNGTVDFGDLTRYIDYLFITFSPMADCS